MNEENTPWPPRPDNEPRENIPVPEERQPIDPDIKRINVGEEPVTPPPSEDD